MNNLFGAVHQSAFEALLSSGITRPEVAGLATGLPAFRSVVIEQLKVWRFFLAVPQRVHFPAMFLVQKLGPETPTIAGAAKLRGVEMDLRRGQQRTGMEV